MQDAGRPRVALAYLGCKVNQAEIEELGQELPPGRLQGGRARDQADVYILNSCTVTHVADRKTRLLIHQMVQRNPEALIVVTGCYRLRRSAAWPPSTASTWWSPTPTSPDWSRSSGSTWPPARRRWQPDAERRRRAGAHPFHAQGAGRLRQLLHLLHRAPGARWRAQPAHCRGGGRWCAGRWRRAIKRSF